MQRNRLLSAYVIHMKNVFLSIGALTTEVTFADTNKQLKCLLAIFETFIIITFAGSL